MQSYLTFAVARLHDQPAPEATSPDEPDPEPSIMDVLSDFLR